MAMVEEKEVDPSRFGLPGVSAGVAEATAPAMAEAIQTNRATAVVRVCLWVPLVFFVMSSSSRLIRFSLPFTHPLCATGRNQVIF